MIFYTAEGGTRFRWDPASTDVHIQLTGEHAAAAKVSLETKTTLTVQVPALDLQEFVSKVLLAQARTK